MANLLNSKVDYHVTRTAMGTWHRYLYESGALYREYKSHVTFFGVPLIHFVVGRNPETGYIDTARGIIAIGQKALGLVAVGQAVVGLVAIGQLAVGLLVGVGQATCGLLAVGQAAVGLVVVGQFAAGGWVLAQLGFGGDLPALLRH